ncbi:hypothetical protein EJD97_003681 [Solanum chilense]|uniref:Uncharacterized protein n=1 Tax=Solanum chilense TaxID=4083 RepID=A0A6N2C0K7_SOLCI|nr:hypothetical protein EJD97_003681 [Solanum chilense]
MLVTVRRWHRSEAAEERWGSLTKCGVTKCMTDRRSHDSLSCWFVVKIREVVPVPKFQEYKCYGTDTLNGHCVCDDPSYLPSRVMKRATEEFAKMGLRSP